MSAFLRHLSRSPILRGLGSVLDLGAVAFRTPRDARPGPLRDAEAMARDWRRVGGDLRSAMHAFHPEQSHGQAR